MLRHVSAFETTGSIDDRAALGGVHPATVVAVALGLAVFCWHAWATLRGYFWQDDFLYIGRAATEPLSIAETRCWDTPMASATSWTQFLTWTPSLPSRAVTSCS